jgi:hypothetical protein
MADQLFPNTEIGGNELFREMPDGTFARVVAVESRYLVVSPNNQASTALAAVVTGSEIDARPFRSISYTLLNANNTITYWIYGAHRLDFADEVIASGPTDILASAVGSYSVSPAPFSYYRVKIQDKVGGSHGTVAVVGLAKA